MDWKDLFHHKGRRVCHSLVRVQRNIPMVHVNKPSRPSFRVGNSIDFVRVDEAKKALIKYFGFIS